MDAILENRNKAEYDRVCDIAISEWELLQPKLRELQDRVHNLKALINAIHNLTGKEIPDECNFEFIHRTVRSRPKIESPTTNKKLV